MASHLTRHWKLAVVWALSLVAVGAISSAQRNPSCAISTDPRPPCQLPRSSLATTSASESSGRRIGIQIGKVVVRIGGVWVDTAPSAITTR